MNYNEQRPEPIWPYHRCYRPVRGKDVSSIEVNDYLVDHDYARYPEKYTRAFLQTQDEMKVLFRYIEPGDINLKTYSYQIQQLLIQICIEIEANFKAILKENTYSSQEKTWRIEDYKKIETSYKLSEYKVILPTWDGKKNTFQPFLAWKDGKPLKWYKAYNNVKHNWAERLKEANFKNLMDAFCGLFVLISAQFGYQEYSTLPCLISMDDEYKTFYEGKFGIGDILQVVFS